MSPSCKTCPLGISGSLSYPRLDLLSKVAIVSSGDLTDVAALSREPKKYDSDCLLNSLALAARKNEALDERKVLPIPPEMDSSFRSSGVRGSQDSSIAPLQRSNLDRLRGSLSPSFRLLYADSPNRVTIDRFELSRLPCVVFGP